MRVGDAFPGSWLKAADLQGRAVNVVIDKVELEDVGDGEKPVLHFQGKGKALVLNKTNAMMIAAYYGEEMDDWKGRAVTLYPDKTSFQGRIVDCLRVRVESNTNAGPQQPQAPAQTPPPAQPEPPAMSDDEIPF